MANYVTIATFYTLHEAELLRGRLEVEGFDAIIGDQYTITANPLYANAIGGVKVQVPEADVATVQELLAELELELKNEEE